MKKDRSEPNAEKGGAGMGLRELLRLHRVPEPSRSFVEETLFRIALTRHEVPAPSSAFVDRVLEDLTPAARTEKTPSAFRPILLFLASAAAALVLHLGLGTGRNLPPGLRELWRSPANFPTHGENPFARSVALVRSGVFGSTGAGEEFWFPPAPAPGRENRGGTSSVLGAEGRAGGDPPP